MAKLSDLKVTIGLSKAGLTKLNADLRRVKGNFRRNFGEIAGMVKNAALAIGTVLVGAIATMIRSAAKMETVRVSFRSIMGSAEGAAQMVEKLNKFAAHTPFQLEDISTAARQLLAVGVKESDIEKTLKTLGDIAAATGSSITEMSAIYAKAQAKGKIDQEILNQLLDRGINIKQELLKVTGQTSDEFKAASVSVEDFNKAINNMAEAGGFAQDAMENLSQTTEGLLSTLADVTMQAAAQAADQSGLSFYFKSTLNGAIELVNGTIKTTDAAVEGLSGSFNDLMRRTMRPTQATVGDLTDELQEMEAGLKAALETSASNAMTKRLQGMLDGTRQAIADINQAFLAGLPAGETKKSKKPDDEETLEEFTARLEAAAALREQQEALLELTRQQVVADGDLIVAQEGLRAAYGGLRGEIVEVTMAEEEFLDEGDQERIAYGTNLIQRAAFAAQNMGAAFNITSGMIGAAFDNIKDRSQGFHLYLKSMLEDLLKKALALAAAFAAMSLFMGPTAMAKGVGSFGSFMKAGLGFGGLPQMAHGGLFTGASLAMIGEGAGTSMINPEVVAPLDKLQQMMGGGNVTVTGRLDGRDILISSERAGFDRNRVRGF